MNRKEKLFSPQDIHLYWPWEIPPSIHGTAVVADTYAATTNISTMLAQRPARLLVVNKANVSFAREKYPNALIIGESQDFPKDYFHVANFPAHLENVDVAGRIIIYMTTNGTKVIETTFEKDADAVITVGFNNLQSIAEWLFTHAQSQTITLIPAGDITQPDPKVLEDLICAQALQKLLLGEPINWHEELAKVHDFVFSHYRAESLEADVKTLLNLNCYRVVPFCIKEDGIISIVDAS